MNASPLRRVLALCTISLVAACAGGTGAGGGCGANALPGGFPRDKAMENAGTLRLTRPGLDFLAQNGPSLVDPILGSTNGVLSFTFPEAELGETSLVLGRVKPTICSGGPTGSPPSCTARARLGAAKLKLDAVTPNAVLIRADIPLSLSDTPVKLKYSSLLIKASPTFHFAYGANGRCNGGIASADERVLKDVLIKIPLVAETINPRSGYTKLDVDNAEIDLSGITSSDLQACADCGLLSGVCSSVTDFAVGLVIGTLRSAVETSVKSALGNFTCTPASVDAAQPCPDGSKPNSAKLAEAKCVYTSNPTKCVPRLIGTDTKIELGRLLAGFSPGSKGAIEIGLAAAGPMIAYPNKPADNVGYPGHTPNGMTLNMLGGAIPAPASGCVQIAPLTLPTGIPTPDELKGDSVPGWTEPAPPHVGIALAGRYLDYTLGSMYNSGLLCLGTSTEQVGQLQSGLISLLIPSIKNYAFEQKQAPMAIATRPQAPPKVVLGGGTNLKTDPLLKVSIPRFMIDFYIWNYDRFVRILTYQADLSIPVNLQTAKSATNPNGGLVPTIGDIGVTNPVVTNVSMIYEDPAKLAVAISELVGGLAGQFLGNGLGPIDLSSITASFGLGINIPSSGIRKLTKDNDDFLAIFATLTKATASLGQVGAETKILSKTVDPDGLRIATLSRDARPELHVQVRPSVPAALADLAAEKGVEYAYAIDYAPLSAWSTTVPSLIQDPALFLQGKHVLRVSARVVGTADTEDATSTALPFTIDVLPPEIDVAVKNGEVHVRAFDFVSPASEIRVRTARDSEPFGAWQPLADLQPQALGATSTLRVEAQDGEGNIGQIAQPLIRGRGDASLPAQAGCGCSTPQGSNWSAAHLALGAGAIVLLAALRRRRAAERARGPQANAFARGRLAAHGVAVAAVVCVAAVSEGCSCGSEEKSGCGSDCNQPCQAPLPVGIIGAYPSVAKGPDGTTWVAGFNDAALTDGESFLYSDLAIGKFDIGKGRVAWRSVDGLPTRAEQTCPDNDPKGWRRGEVDGGDSVGLWTALAVGADNAPMVAYYDATNRALKFAIGNREGSEFRVHYVQKKAGSDFGRYAKMLLVDGKPVLAFLALEPGDKGVTKSRVVVARAKIAAPLAENDWSFEDATVDNAGPCRAGACPSGEACIKSTGVCTKTTTGCTPADCGGRTSACITVAATSTCAALTSADTPESYPNGVGAYISMANGPSGLGIVAYDRVHGNLLALKKNGAAWATTVLDGETGSRPQKTAVDTGDTGVGASLAIDASDTWHVSYVSGLDESLRYLSFAGGKVATPIVVDDGLGTDVAPFTDGRHFVGDDSNIRVDGSSLVIAYQDATAGTLRVATGAAGGKTWKRKVVEQPNRFAGYFPQWMPGEPTKLLNFYRETKRETREMFGDVAVVQP